MVNERIAKNIKKFILSFYKEVDIVEVKIQLYTQDIPTITVYFRQDEPYRNANQILCQNIRRNIKDFLNYTVVGYILLSWEARLPENKNPVARIQCVSINVDSFNNTNLQENIQRIRSMMKLLNENIDNSCKERAYKLLPIAVNHWKNWLSHPETKQKFSKNHNYDLNKTEEIFRKYFSILENFKVVFFHGDEIEGLEKNTSKIKNEIKKSSNADAFVIPEISNLIFFNCAFGDQTEEVLIHEINHILDGVHPINPWKMVYDVLYDQPETPKNFNMNNLSKSLDILGVQDENQKQKIIQKYIQIYNGDEIKKFYTCDLWEKSANIHRIRKMFRIQPGQNITLNDLKPYFLFEIETQGDVRWFIMCWIKQGFKDLNSMINNFNLLAKTDKSNNNFV